METIKRIEAAASPDRGLEPELALALAAVPDREVWRLFPTATRLREAASGQGAYLCSIVNAKSGRCSEDCRFCAQSARWPTGAPSYPLLAREVVLTAAAEAKRYRAREFSVVTSGKGVTDPTEIEAIAGMIAGTVALGLNACVSPGVVADETLSRWKEAGLSRYHHNLEAAPSFFPKVCSTHPLEEDVAALRRAKALGLAVCAGGIFGMGESWAQRVELIELLRGLAVDSVPVNLLNPIAGTPLFETAPGIGPLEALKTIVMIRLMMPRTRIILCGGRDQNLRDLQALVFAAGANGLMIGNYLTTPGRPPDQDLQLLEDLELRPLPP